MKRSSTISILFTLIVVVVAATGCGDDGPSGTPDAEPDGQQPPGAACGGRDAIACAADQYCDYRGNDCGRNDTVGECKPRPTNCPILFTPELTCGCDDVVHSSACDATAAGADLNQTGSCRPETGQFTCGFRVCGLHNEYCKHVGSDVASEPDDFACGLFVLACGASPSCTCLATEMCGDDCAGDPDVGFTLTCRGG